MKLGDSRPVLTVAVGALVTCALFVGACGSPDQESPPPLQGAPTRTPGRTSEDASITDAGTSDSGETTIDANKPPQTVNWSGQLAASPTVAFGGVQYCKYSVTMKNIFVDMLVDDAGSATNGVVQAVMEEKIVSDCGTATPKPANTHTYTQTKPATSSGGSLRIEFQPSAKNSPKATLVFDGTFANATELDGKLTWHRIDIDSAPELSWTVTATVHLTPASH